MAETPSGEASAAEASIAGGEQPAVQKQEDWEFLASPEDDGDDGGEGPIAETPAAATATETSEVKETPAPASATAVETPKAETPTPATSPAAEALRPATETPAQKSPQELEADARAAAERVEGELTEYYKIPDEMAEQLRTEPEVALPKLAAKLHQTVLGNVLMQVNAMLPRAMMEFSQVQRAETEAKSVFYERWPGLKDYEPQVLQAGRMFKAMNPQATREQALEGVGAMVYAAMGMQVPGASASAVVPAAAAGTTPTAAAPARAAFRPAAPGGGTPAGAPPRSGNEYERIAEEFLEEDQG